MRVPFKSFIEKEIGPHTILITCGLPATNKTETGEVIARMKGFAILRTDIIRREILSEEEVFDEKAAADMGRRNLVYDRLFRDADVLAAQGASVILDATFVTQALRRRAAATAARNGCSFVIEQTNAPAAYSLAKISMRTRDDYESNALTPEAYMNNMKKFEPVDLQDLKRLFPGLSIMFFLVDTSSDSEDEWFVSDRAVP